MSDVTTTTMPTLEFGVPEAPQAPELPVEAQTQAIAKPADMADDSMLS